MKEDYGITFEPHEPKETKVFINTFHVIVFFIFVDLALIVLTYIAFGILGCLLIGGMGSLVIYYPLKIYIEKKDIVGKVKE